MVEPHEITAQQPALTQQSELDLLDEADEGLDQLDEKTKPHQS